MERHKGTVKWFDAKKGFGFVYSYTLKQDVFVHFTGIEGTGYRSLPEGAPVDFEVIPYQRGTEQSFKAINVRVVKK